MVDVRVNGGAAGRVALNHDFGDAPLGHVGRLGPRSVRVGQAPPLRAPEPTFGEKVSRFFERALNVLSPPGLRAEREHRQSLRDTSAALGHTLGALIQGDHEGAQMALAQLRGAAEGALRGGGTLQDLVRTRLEVHLARLAPEDLAKVVRHLSRGPDVPRGDFAALRDQIVGQARGRLLEAATAPVVEAIRLGTSGGLELGGRRFEDRLNLSGKAMNGANLLAPTQIFGGAPGLSQAILRDALALSPAEGRRELLAKLGTGTLGPLATCTVPSLGGLDLSAVDREIAGVIESKRAALVESIGIKADSLAQGMRALARDPADLATRLGALRSDLADFAELCRDCRLDASAVDGQVAAVTHALLEMPRLDPSQLARLPEESLGGLMEGLRRFDVPSPSLAAEVEGRRRAATQEVGLALDAAIGRLAQGGDTLPALETLSRATHRLDAALMTFSRLGTDVRGGDDLAQLRGNAMGAAVARAYPEGTDGLRALYARLNGPELGPLTGALMNGGMAVSDMDNHPTLLGSDLGMLRGEVARLLEERGVEPDPAYDIASAQWIGDLTGTARDALVRVGLVIEPDGRASLAPVHGTTEGDDLVRTGWGDHVMTARRDHSNDVARDPYGVTAQFGVDVVRDGRHDGRYVIAGEDGRERNLLADEHRPSGITDEVRLEGASRRLREAFGDDLAFRVSQVMNQSSNAFLTKFSMDLGGTNLRDDQGRTVIVSALRQNGQETRFVASPGPDGTARVRVEQRLFPMMVMVGDEMMRAHPSSVVRAEAEILLHADGRVEAGPVRFSQAILPQPMDD